MDDPSLKSNSAAAKQYIMPGPENPSVLIVLLASFFVPGLGHILLGQREKGLIYLLSFYGLTVASLFLSVIVVGLLLLPLTLVHWSIVFLDAYFMADKLGKGQKISDLECAFNASKFLLFGFFPQAWVSVERGAPVSEYYQEDF